MSFVEKIKKVINMKEEAGVVLPTQKLSNVLTDSNILNMMNKLRDSTLIIISNEIIENGSKMVITAEWMSDGNKQAIVSVTENSISFIGNISNNNYKRLEAQDIHNSELIESSLLNMFSDSSQI